MGKTRKNLPYGIKSCVCDTCGNIRIIRKEYWQVEGREEFLYDFCGPCWEVIKNWIEIQERKKDE